jgi:hypothetical protein
MFDRNKIGYNFVFMFASPSHIVESTKCDKKVLTLDPISHRAEYSLIKESLKKSKKEVTMHKVHGTYVNFSEVLERQRPGAIHFSGHGVSAEKIRKWHMDHR